jgi:hypothetical protein
MTATYEKIATTTLGSAAATITFTSISGTYTDLILVTSGTSTTSTICIRFNNDTGSNYSDTYIYGDGSSAGSGRHTSATKIFGSSVGSTVSTDIFQIQNYSNTTTYKTCLIRGSLTTSAATAFVGLWRSTSAITRIDLFNNNSGDFDSGFIATIYGIKAE